MKYFNTIRNPIRHKPEDKLYLITYRSDIIKNFVITYLVHFKIYKGMVPLRYNITKL